MQVSILSIKNGPFSFSCLAENLVPNIFLELFFVIQLLTSQSTHTCEDEEESLCAANSGLKLVSTSFASHSIFPQFKLKIISFWGSFFRCPGEMLPETSTQLCVFCSEASRESVSVSFISCAHMSSTLILLFLLAKSSQYIFFFSFFFFGRLVAHLDKCTLRLLAENERVVSFSPDLRDRLTQAQDKSTAKVTCLYCTAIITH